MATPEGMFDRSITSQHCSCASLPETVYHFSLSILSPGTDNLVSLIQRKDCNVPDTMVDLGASRLRSGHASDRAPASGFFTLAYIRYVCE